MWGDGPASLFPLHGLSPTLKSLSLFRSCIPPSEVLNLICSFPLLEDLELCLLSKDNDVTDEWSAPSTLPKLTGSIDLSGEVRSVISRLLGLQNCFRFAKVVTMCQVEDADLTSDLVMKCSKTLESLSIGHSFSSAFHSAFVVGQYT
jgi:hypothetical protein